MQDNVSQALSRLRDRLEGLYGQRLVGLILFGSQARGEARRWSDVDVLVVLKEPVDDFEEARRTETLIAELCLQFDLVIVCIFMAESQYLAGEGLLLHNIAREGVRV